MMRKFMATTAIVTLMAAGGAFAQTTSPTTPVAPVTPTEQASPQIIHADGHLASNIIGQTVYSGTGDDAQDIGRISDLVLSPDGEAEAAVVGVGGFLGIGQKDVAIEYDLLHWADRDDSRYLVVETTKEALDALPVFDKAAYQPMPADAAIGNTKPASGAEIGAATPPATAPTTETTTTETTTTETAEAPADSNDTGMDATDTTQTAAIDRSGMTEVVAADISADELIGTDVYGANDEDVGSIADVILSTDGTVDAVTVDVGGFLGIGAKEVALDLDNLAFMRNDNDLYLYTSLTKGQLEAQSAYDASTFADNRDQQLLVIER